MIEYLVSCIINWKNSFKNWPCRFGFHSGKWGTMKEESWTKFLNGKKLEGSTYIRLVQVFTCDRCGLSERRFVE